MAYRWYPLDHLTKNGAQAFYAQGRLVSRLTIIAYYCGSSSPYSLKIPLSSLAQALLALT